MFLKQYIETQSKGDAHLRRRLEKSFENAGISVVTANTTEAYKKTIDDLLAKMKLKRAPLEGRVPTRYEAQLGEHDKKVLAGIDPIDGGKLEKIYVNDEREAMYNPRTHIVWPIPVPKSEQRESA